MMQRPHLPMIIDSFAGGGGASTGIEQALGRSPDVAINHSEKALALHAANHPETLHLDSNIWDVDPVEVCKGRRVGLLWASPDCKHFSKAKGGAPRDRNIRDLAWIVVKWAEEAKPDVICMENVEEFVTWGPVDNDGQPIKEFAGQTFDLFIRRLRKAGYKVQWRELRACDYGAPTIRKRWFLVARRDGRPIIWPKATHGNPTSLEVRKGKLLPWRTAAECIDWSLPCPSIFDTGAEIMAKHGLRAVRPLANNTLARVARGMKRYVLEAERPFLVNLKGMERRDRSVDAPHPTVLAGGGHSAVVAPYLATFYGHGEQRGKRAADMTEPLRTVTVENRHALVAPVLTYAQQGGGNRSAEDPHHTICASRKDQNSLIAATMVQTGYGERTGQQPRSLDVAAPLGTVVAGGAKHAPIAAFLAQQNGGPRMGCHSGHDARDPLSTVAASGSHQTPVAAWMAKWYGTDQDPRLGEPLHTVTTKDRFDVEIAQLAVPPFTTEHEARARQVAHFLRAHDAWDGGEFVTLTIGSTRYVVIDIGMRMLTPRELFNAQGFPADYVIDGVWEGVDTDSPTWRAFPKDVQVSCCGNSVCPPLAEALIAANCGHLRVEALEAQA
nr:DNA cytosine methyltransferase [Paracoccus saliphilus]